MTLSLPLPQHELDRQAGIHVSRTTHRHPFPPIHLLLMEGDYYWASPEALACLRAGYPVAELDLERAPTEDEGE